MVPMLTLSWLWLSVLRLKAVAGMVSFSASAASAEVAICIALKPWWVRASAPVPAIRFAGRPPLVSGMQSRQSWRSRRSATLATAVFRPSIAKPTWPP